MSLVPFNIPGRRIKPEAQFQKAIINYLRARYQGDLWWVNVRGGLGMRSGLPDLISCIKGRLLAIEVKNPDGSGRLSPYQERELEAIRQAGGMALVVKSWEALEGGLKEFDKKLNEEFERGYRAGIREGRRPEGSPEHGRH